MRKRWNLAPLAGLVLAVLAVVGYFALVLRQDPTLRPWIDTPVLSLALLAGGVGLALAGVSRAWRAGRGNRAVATVLGGLTVALAAFFTFYIFGSSYDLPPAVGAPVVGAPAPSLSLRDQTGAALDLASLRGRNVVLVFYRGFW